VALVLFGVRRKTFYLFPPKVSLWLLTFSGGTTLVSSEKVVLEEIFASIALLTPKPK